MKRSASSRTFTLEIEVSNLTDEIMNLLDGELTQIRMATRSIENILSGRQEGQAALVITDEKQATDIADLELF